MFEKILISTNLSKTQTNLQNVIPLLHRLLLARHLVERLFLCDVVGRVTSVVRDVTDVAPVARSSAACGGGGGRDEGGLLHFGGAEQVERGVAGVPVGRHRRFGRLRVVRLLRTFCI